MKKEAMHLKGSREVCIGGLEVKKYCHEIAIPKRKIKENSCVYTISFLNRNPSKFNQVTGKKGQKIFSFWLTILLFCS